MKNKKIFLFGLIIILLATLYSCEEKNEGDGNLDLPENFISYYPLDGNANDEGHNGLDGNIHGAVAAADRMGNADGAMRFDGKDDYIQIDDYGDIVPKVDISVSMWLKSYDSKPQFQLKLLPDNNRFAVSAFYNHDGRNTTFWDFGWTGETGNAPGRLYYRPEPIDTLWHHYVFISSISEEFMRIYKDGELLNEKNEPKALLNVAGRDLKIGSGDNRLYYNGVIDEIIIYDRVLTEEEIMELFQN